MNIITCNSLLYRSSGVDPAIPLGFLSKLWSWYDWEDSTADGWGAWPISYGGTPATYGDASSFGSGMTGRCTINGNNATKETLPNWAASTSFFLGAMRSSNAFTLDQATALVHRTGNNEAIALSENASGFRIRGMNGATVYGANTTDSVSTWTLSIAEHAAAGTIRFHKNTTLSAATNAGNATLNPTSAIRIGNIGGGIGAGANMAFLFYGKGEITQDELDYLYNAGAGRTIAGIISDAGYTAPTMQMAVTSGSPGLSYSGKRTSNPFSPDAYLIANTGRSTGKYWYAVRILRRVNGNVLMGVGTTTSAQRYNYFTNAGSANIAGTTFTAATNPALTFTDNDYMMVLVDFTAKKIWLGKNGTVSGNPALGTGHAATFTGTPTLYPHQNYNVSEASTEFYFITGEMPTSNPTGYTPWGD